MWIFKLEILPILRYLIREKRKQNCVLKYLSFSSGLNELDLCFIVHYNKCNSRAVRVAESSELLVRWFCHIYLFLLLLPLYTCFVMYSWQVTLFIIYFIECKKSVFQLKILHIIILMLLYFYLFTGNTTIWNQACYKSKFYS